MVARERRHRSLARSEYHAGTTLTLLYHQHLALAVGEAVDA